MLKNYLLVAIRNLFRNKILTFVNIAGLAFGLLCSLLMFFWVWDEIQTDKFHNKAENIYQVFGEINNNGEIIISQYAPSSLADPLKSDLPEIKDICRVFPARVVFENRDIKFTESGVYADSSLFSIFSFPFKEGDPDQAFSDPNTVVISSKLAEKYFPEENALGKSLGIIQKELSNYVIKGVMQNLPANSSLHFDFVLSYDQFEQKFRPWWSSSNKSSFNNFNVSLYAELEPGVDMVRLNDKLSTYIANYTREQNKNALFVYPFANVYLHSDFSQGRIPTGKIRYVKLMSIIAAIVFLIACINFINLSTATAGQRAKEVGLRKVIGATRWQLVIQFFIESILISFCAMVIALTFLEILLPFFNYITQKHIDVPFRNPGFILIITGLIISTGLMAGGYPSFVLSSFKPLKSLTELSPRTGGLTGIRRGLVFIQFTISISFIVYTLVVYDQIHFIQNKQLGIRKENIVYHQLNGIRNHTKSYRNELLKINGVQSVTFTEQDPFNTSNRNSHVEWNGKPSNSTAFFNLIQVGEDFTKTFEMGMATGEGFSETYSEDSPKQFLINEAAAKTIGVEDPVGMSLNIWGYEGTIKGVVRNYHHQPLVENIEPVIIIYSPEQTWNAYISLNTEDIQGTIGRIRDVYTSLESEYPFDYNFVDEQFNRTYNDIINVGKMSNIFSSVAIIISCLGLFGLSAFIIEQKRKETGIRKVLGANQVGLVYLFSTDFVKLIFFSFVVAAPVSWLYSKHWLSDFSFRTEIGIAPFAIAGISALVISLLTISYNTIRAADANPVDLLKQE